MILHVLYLHYIHCTSICLYILWLYLPSISFFLLLCNFANSHALSQTFCSLKVPVMLQGRRGTVVECSLSVLSCWDLLYLHTSQPNAFSNPHFVHIIFFFHCTFSFFLRPVQLFFPTFSFSLLHFFLYSFCPLSSVLFPSRPSSHSSPVLLFVWQLY